MSKSSSKRKKGGLAMSSLKRKRCPNKEKYLSGKRILPKGLTGREELTDIIQETFLAYNSARLREACMLFSRKILKKDVLVGMSLAGALTPAGIGCSCIVPLIKAGFIDWIVSTGANLYHDLHFAFNRPLYMGSQNVNDIELKKNDIVRIYDILLEFWECLDETDLILRDIICGSEFQKEMGSAEFHYLLGKHAAGFEKKNGLKDVSVLAAAYRAGVPVFTSSPGDSAIGMNIAAGELEGKKLKINPSIDVNESTALVLASKRSGGKSAAVLIGGGSPKNFLLQTEPQIQEILRLQEVGHDYFLQFTDARPDTGGLSGATPHEAVSWGKIDPAQLLDSVVCYTDSTIALPILTHYALANAKKRKLKRLYSKRKGSVKAMKKEYFAMNVMLFRDNTRELKKVKKRKGKKRRKR